MIFLTPSHPWKQNKQDYYYIALVSPKIPPSGILVQASGQHLLQVYIQGLGREWYVQEYGLINEEGRETDISWKTCDIAGGLAGLTPEQETVPSEIRKQFMIVQPEPLPTESDDSIAKMFNAH